MIQCQDCGAVMEPGPRYCPQCGAPTEMSGEVVSRVPPTKIKAHYCGKCGAKMVSSRKTCLICGARAGEIPPEPAKPAPPARPADRTPFAKRKNHLMTHTALLLSALLIVAGLGSWAWQVVPDLLSSDRMRADNAILYVQNGGVLRIKSADSNEALTIAEPYGIRGELATDTIAQSSAGGRYLAYLNQLRKVDGEAVGNLYLLDLGKATRSNARVEEQVLVAENVSDVFFFSSTDRYLVYMTASRELWLWDFEDHWQLDADIAGIFDVSDSQVLYYARRQPGDQIQAFLQNLDNSERTEVGSMHALLDWTPDFSQILYAVQHRDSAGDLVSDVSIYHGGSGETAGIVAGAYGILDCSARDGSVLYLRGQTYQMSYEDFIDDDMAQIDALMKEPDMSLYPELEDYFETYGEFPEEWEAIDGSEEQDTLTILHQQYRNWRNDQLDYEEKQGRDSLREKIQGDIDQLYRSDMRLYEMGVADETGETVFSRRVVGLNDAPLAMGSLGDRAILFGTADTGLLEQVVISKLSREEQEHFSIGDMLLRSVRQQLWYSGFDGEPVSLFTAERGTRVADLFVTDDRESIYFRVLRRSAEADTGGALYYSGLANQAPSEAVLIDQGVQVLHGPQTFEGGVLYFKDYANGSGNLYSAQKSTVSLTAYDVAADTGLQIHNGGKTLLYYENYSRSRQVGDLYLTAQQKRQITTEVHDVYYRSDDLIYLRKNMRDGGDLYAYSGGVLALVDSHVTHVFPMNRTAPAVAEE